MGADDDELTVHAEVRHASRNRLTAAIATGTPFTFADGSIRHAQEPSTYRFDRRRWSHVIELVEPAVHWYGNITTPARLDDGVLAWHDIELDVEAFADGSWWFTDVPEFAEALRAYPPAERARGGDVYTAGAGADGHARGHGPNPDRHREDSSASGRATRWGRLRAPCA